MAVAYADEPAERRVVFDAGYTYQEFDMNSNDAGQAVDQATDKLRDLGGQVRDAATDKYNEARDTAKHYMDEGRAAAEEWEQSIEGYVQNKPLQAVLIAAGVGLLVGLLWKRS
jgi:ElaB/YqjD/DUF883 family membrane-anchored ribosome-binding protein